MGWTQHLEPQDYRPEYLSVGAFPDRLSGPDRSSGRSGMEEKRVQQTLTQCVLFLPKNIPGATGAPDTAFAAALLAKFLRRGTLPPPTLGVERAALEEHGLLDSARCLHDSGSPEMGWELARAWPPKAADVRYASVQREEFALDPVFAYTARDADLGSRLTRAETAFLKDWLPKWFGPRAGHWFTPQPPFGSLLGGTPEASPRDERRGDFLFWHPGAGQPAVIEIDGPEHDQVRGVDQARDAALRGKGYDVVRIPNAEVLGGEGTQLSRIRTILGKASRAIRTGESTPEACVALSCARAAQLQFVLIRAFECGCLPPGGVWRIELTGADRAAVAGVGDVLQLLKGLDATYGLANAPRICSVVRADKDEAEARHWENGDWKGVRFPEESPEDDRLRIAVESGASPFHRLPSRESKPDFILRPAFVPVEIATRDTFGEREDRRKAAPSVSSDVLRVFLRHGFRKSAFWPKQAEAVHNVLRQNDGVVLLPTGAGKSIIYQLAGLLMPGVTLVVDPLVALIDDQVRGMLSLGLDRAVGLSAGLSRGEKEERLENIRDGRYHFVLVAPERLQGEEFRATLASIKQSASVNLVVVDEAHCVSEWGHDFRPSYLNLGPNVQRHCRSANGAAPPLLGMTGTASRAVLRDMLADLGIDRTRSDAVIRPDSFDRGELTFQIERFESRNEAHDALDGVLRALPQGAPVAEGVFWQPRGPQTNATIVFCPTVGGRTHGLDAVATRVTKVTGTHPALYSGQPPKSQAGNWHKKKEEYAKRFIENEVSVLVATKSFGMGIDKANIRRVVHMGLPPSLEAYYQEVGRAGRDKNPSKCILLFAEWDRKESEALLDPRVDLDTLKQRWEDMKRRQPERQWADDLASQLFFHLGAFKGKDEDVRDVEEVLDELSDFSSKQHDVPVPFRNRESQEKAFYRLRRIGVVTDYRVDWGRRMFEVDTSGADRDECCERLLGYLKTVQPAKSRPFAALLEGVPKEPRRAVALDLVRILVDFTYDHIERSRRRSMQEATRWARESRNDKEIRQRMLDYLQEGDWAREIDALVDEEHVNLERWWKFADEHVNNAAEAAELRGICIRNLESNPDHPGLLLVRGVLETMCSDGDAAVAASELESGLRQCEAHELEPRGVTEWIEHAVRAATQDPRYGSGKLAMTWALFGLGNDGAEPSSGCLAELKRRSQQWMWDLGEGPGNDDVAAVAATATVCEVLQHLVDQTPSVAKWTGPITTT